MPTALAGITLIRGDVPSAPTPVLYTPRLYIGIEGDKELAVGDTPVRYGDGEELVASLAIPVTGRIATAPYFVGWRSTPDTPRRSRRPSPSFASATTSRASPATSG